MFRGAAPRTPGARGQGRAALLGRAGPGGGCALLLAPSLGLVPSTLSAPSSPGSVLALRAGRRGRVQGCCGQRRLRPGLRDDAGTGGRRWGAGRGAPDSGIARWGWARAPGAGAESGGAMNGGRGGGRGAEPSPKWLLSRGSGAEPAGKPGCWIQRGGRAGRGGGGEAGPLAAWSAPPSGAGLQRNNNKEAPPPARALREDSRNPRDWRASWARLQRWRGWALDHFVPGLVPSALRIHALRAGAHAPERCPATSRLVNSPRTLAWIPLRAHL